MKKILPKSGDERIIKKFLFAPRVIDRELRWMETVYIRQFYYHPQKGGSWCDDKWCTKEEWEKWCLDV